MTEKKTEPKLTPKQRKFINEYIKEENKTQAALKAGYSKKSAAEMGYENMKKPHVQDAYNKKLNEVFEKLQIGPEFVFNGFKTVANRCMQAKPKMVYDRVAQQHVQDQDPESGELLYEFDSNGANRALELLGKGMRLFTDRVEIVEDQGAVSRFDRATDNAEE